MKKITGNILIALVLLGLGIFVGTRIPRKISTPKGGQTDSYQAGWNAAKERLAQSPIGGVMVSQATEVKTISGSIQKIEGDKITVKINLTDPLSDPNLDTRTITVNSSTKIVLSVPKSQEQIQKDMADFQEKMKSQTQIDPANPILPPMPFEKKEIKISDLKVDQQISITANENIKDKKEFVASEIGVQEAVSPQSSLVPPALPNMAPLPSAPVKLNPTPSALTKNKNTATPPAPVAPTKGGIVPAPVVPTPSI